MANRVADNHPALLTKEAVLARSGVYYYSKAEMIARGYTPRVDKPFYSEYRPPEVLQRCKDKFAFAAVTVEHTPEETGPDNFSRQVTGVIGDNIVVKPLGNDVALYGKMAVYTRDGLEYYNKGNRETSADYRSVVKPDSTGKYDFVLQDILSVNGVVLTARGRGGASVRVQDSLNLFGGMNMAGRRGALAFLGIGRTKDDGFKLSKLVLDGARQLHSLDAAGKEKMVLGVMEHINPLGDGQVKDLLIGAVKDAFDNPIDAVAKEADVARVIDGLYTGAVAADLKAADDAVKALESQAKDGGCTGKEGCPCPACKEKAGKEGEKKEGPPPPTKDSTKETPADIGKIIDDAVAKAMSRSMDSISGMVDKAVAKALNIKDEEGGGTKTQDGTGNRTEDGGADAQLREEASFLLNSNGMF